MPVLASEVEVVEPPATLEVGQVDQRLVVEGEKIENHQLHYVPNTRAVGEQAAHPLEIGPPIVTHHDEFTVENRLASERPRQRVQLGKVSGDFTTRASVH